MSNIVIVGGCGHVGLPLGLMLANSSHNVVALDTDEIKCANVNLGKMPFLEDDAELLLRSVLDSGKFIATTEVDSLRDAEIIVMVIGTPVDEHMNPDPSAVIKVVETSIRNAPKCELLLLRSTIFPGVTRKIEEIVELVNPRISVSFCPERILEGFAIKELATLPQIIGARTEKAIDSSLAMFSSLGIKSIIVTPEEAEFAKLFSNAWRYIKFAAANEFYNMSSEAGLDYNVILEAIKLDYPRASDIPRAGFAAGPCLLKDTMQLAAFANNNFQLGNSEMMVNEVLPLRIVERLKRQYELQDKVVGILGMSFKAGSDDTRSSLSYKLKKILQFEASRVITTDPYVQDDPEVESLEKVLQESDILILAVPHKEYLSLRLDIPIIDTWGLINYDS